MEHESQGFFARIPTVDTYMGALQKEISLRVDFFGTTLANDLVLLVNKFRGIL
jgi:hypothetical protein